MSFAVGTIKKNTSRALREKFWFLDKVVLGIAAASGQPGTLCLWLGLRKRPSAGTSPGKKASLLVFNNIKEISLCMRIPNEYNMSCRNIDEHKHKPSLYVYIFEILKFPLHIQTPFFETLSWGTVFSKTHKNPLRLSLHESK
jgi:hypothetical protein